MKNVLLGAFFAFASLASATATATTSASDHTTSPPTFNLDYGSYFGYYNDTSELNVWKSIRYAAPPVGDLRWAAAQEPEDQRHLGPINATEYPLQCPQSTLTNASINGEDCLFLTVYAPPLDTEKKKELLPVLVWIHGGGWDHNSLREFDPTPMIMSTNNSFIGITLQYRLGAFGFLSHPSIRASGGLNAGVTDARFALQWVQKYVSLVGGDKERVSIWGQSSGGGTILDLVAGEYWAQTEGGETLFEGVIASSPYQVPMLSCDNAYFKNQFTNFSAAANCTNDLACLRAANTSLLQLINTHTDVYIQQGEISAYVPCVEGFSPSTSASSSSFKGQVTPYLRESTTTQLIEGRVAGKYGFAGNNLHDGSGFVPTSLDSAANLTEALLSEVMAIFPVGNGTAEEIISFYPPENFTDNHARGAQIFQDATFGCPTNWLLSNYGENAYRYLYAIGTAVHAQDNAYEFPIWYNTLAPYSPTMYAEYIGSATSFIRSASPNTFPSPDLVAGAPTWPHFKGQYAHIVLNVTSAANVSDSYVQYAGAGIGTAERCAMWAKVRVDGGW